MSSLTKAAFIAELQVRSSVMGAMTFDQLSPFVDIGLRAYSRRLPEIRVSADNAVVTDQALYDYPANALSIIRLRDPASLKQISFSVENQGNGDKIRIGSIVTKSYDILMTGNYYNNPLAQLSATVSTSYSNFDIEYVQLQDMDSIKETGLEALADYVEYLVWKNKAEAEAVTSISDLSDTPVSLTDSSSDGASTTVTFPKRTDSVKVFNDLATASLGRFDKAVSKIPYGTRG